MGLVRIVYLFNAFAKNISTTASKLLLKGISLKIKKHHYVVGVLLVLVIIIVFISPIVPGSAYNPNNWASMSIAFGASGLTLVGILTSILASNENNIRNELIEILNRIIIRLEDKERENPDRSYLDLYSNAKNRIRKQIELNAPMKFKEGLLGIFAFYFFMISVLSALDGWIFKITYGSFYLGMAFIVGYVTYLIEEFLKIDARSKIPPKNGSLELLAVKVNGNAVDFNLEEKSKEVFIFSAPKIDRIEFKVKFKGKIRNGFLHAVIRYENNLESHIPDANTNLLKLGFLNDFMLVIYGGEDTGVLQIEDTLDLSFDIPLRIEKGTHENRKLGDMNHPQLGIMPLYQHLSILEDFLVNSIEVRMYEDPLFRPNYKRREVDKITIYPSREQ